MSNMTHAEILTAATLLNAIHAGKKLRWLKDDGTIMQGTLRYVTDNDGEAGYGCSTKDVRTQWIRVTTSWEHWLRFADVMRLLDRCEAAID